MTRLVPRIALMLTLGASNMQNVQLQWKPTDQLGDVAVKALHVFGTRQVTVKPFTDAREDKPLVGRNTEDRTPRLVTTRDDVGARAGCKLYLHRGCIRRRW